MVDSEVYDLVDSLIEFFFLYIFFFIVIHVRHGVVNERKLVVLHVTAEAILEFVLHL